MGDFVKKKIFCVLTLGCLFTFSVKAQLIDMIAGVGVQGQIAAQSSAGIKTALNAIQQNNLINQLNLLIMDIRTRRMGNYQNLDKSHFNHNLNGVDWNIGAVDNNQFFVELKNIDKSSCNRLVNAFNDVITVKINSFVKKDCDNLNSIQLIFE